MKMEPVLEDLEAAAAKLGVRVSYEVLGETVGGGGLCKVKGSYRVIIEKRGTTGEKALTLAKALAALDTEEVFMTPAARQLVDRHKTAQQSGSGSGP
jgi:hypothetical protein